MESFPDDVRQFLLNFIRSVEQLEILRVLGEEPDRIWSTEELQRIAQVPAAAILKNLDELAALGLLRQMSAPPNSTWQYGPQTDLLEGQVSRLLNVYRQRPVTMIRMVYDRTPTLLREFSEAFRLRKKD